MKRFLALLWITSAVFSAHPARGYHTDRDRVLIVEQGDNYLKLFGSDWQKVYRANQDFLTYNRPEKLVVGERLIIPAGTHLTETALERLDRNENFEQAALTAIRQAESMSRRVPRDPAAIYEEGMNLLAKARKTLTGSSLTDYAEAGRYAREALKNFELCSEVRAGLKTAEQNIRSLEDRLQKTAAYTAELENRIRRNASVTTRKTGILQSGLRFVYAHPTVWAGLIVVTAFTWARMSRRRSRKKRTQHVKMWLQQHHERALKLSRSKI